MVEEPTTAGAIPALVFALSATVVDDRIHKVLGKDAAIWRVTVPAPHNDLLKSRKQAQAFREQLRQVMDGIKARHPNAPVIHVFPAMPVALAVEFGRILMPKADLPLRVYDENRKLGGFFPALEINTHKSGERAEC
jgi:SMODS-associated and fused to various effectors sensor domain